MSSDSSIRTSTVLIASAGAILTGILGMCYVVLPKNIAPHACTTDSS